MRRMNGFPDETNTRWQVSDVHEELNIGYQADESDDSASSELDPDEFSVSSELVTDEFSVSEYLDDVRLSEFSQTGRYDRDQYGCSRATLMDHPSGGSNDWPECSRATLMDRPSGGSMRWSGCSRATLMDHPCGGSYRWSGGSRATLIDHPSGGRDRWPGCSLTTLMDQTRGGGYVVQEVLWVTWIHILSLFLLQVLTILLMTYDMTKGLGYICGVDQDGGTWPIHSDPKDINENVSTNEDSLSLVEEAEVGAWEEEIWIEGVTENEIHDDEDLEAHHYSNSSFNEKSQ